MVYKHAIFTIVPSKMVKFENADENLRKDLLKSKECKPNIYSLIKALRDLSMMMMNFIACVLLLVSLYIHHSLLIKK